MTADVPNEGPTAAMRPLAAIHAAAPPRPEIKAPVAAAVSLNNLQMAQADLGTPAPQPNKASELVRVGPSVGTIVAGLTHIFTTRKTGCNFNPTTDTTNLKELELRIEAARVMAGELHKTKTPGYATTGIAIPAQRCDLRIGIDQAGNTVMLVREGGPKGFTPEQEKEDPSLQVKHNRTGRNFAENLYSLGIGGGMGAELPKGQYVSTYAGIIGKDRKTLVRLDESLVDPVTMGLPPQDAKNPTAFTPNRMTFGSTSHMPAAFPDTKQAPRFLEALKLHSTKAKEELPLVPEASLPGFTPPSAPAAPSATDPMIRTRPSATPSVT